MHYIHYPYLLIERVYRGKKMAVYVNTNVSSLNGRRYLNNVQNQLSTTYQRLSSGMRINSAKG